MTAKAYLNTCDDASWCDLVHVLPEWCVQKYSGAAARDSKSEPMAARLSDGAKTDKSAAPVSHFISDGLKVDRVSLLQLSER
jgi:hypothetical protein